MEAAKRVRALGQSANVSPCDGGHRVRFVVEGATSSSFSAALSGPEGHRPTKNANEPSLVATPISIPLIWRIATTQDAAASPSVAVSAAAVALVLALVMAA